MAAIDCGTNSTRMLVAAPGGATIERLMHITRLGHGVDRTHRLDPAAIERTVAVLRSYRETMDRHGVGRVRMTATSAARDATNRAVFFDEARDLVGADVELLGGDAEAGLAFAGATAELPASDGPWLVTDIGGGSTELAAGPVSTSVPGRRRPSAAVSLDMGCVRLSERFLHHDPATPGELEAARRFVIGQLDVAAGAQPELSGPSSLVGLAGTVAAAASLDLGLERYDRALVHHHRLSASTIAALLAALAAETLDDRRRRAGMGRDRADVIVAGLVILDAVMVRFALPVCLVSEADMLDGLVAGLLSGP